LKPLVFGLIIMMMGKLALGLINRLTFSFRYHLQADEPGK